MVLSEKDDLAEGTSSRSGKLVPRIGGRWRVLPSPGDRLPGTFDQDVYVELLHRFREAGAPEDGALTFTLHSFLRSMGRRADGRTYEQLRAALTRLERTSLESQGAYAGPDGRLYVTSLPGGPEDPSLGARGAIFRVTPSTGSAKAPSVRSSAPPTFVQTSTRSRTCRPASRSVSCDIVPS